MQRLFENSPKYWHFSATKTEKKPLRFRESIRGNTKQFIENVEKLLEGYLPTEEDWLGFESTITSFREFNRFGAYAAIKKAVEGGRFACYYNDVKNELAEIYENTPEEKEKWDKFSNEKAWDRYCNVIAMYLPKVFKKKFGRNIGEDMHESLERKQPVVKESKDKFIDRNHNLTDEEKEEIKDFFTRYPYLQSMINWSEAVDLEYEDFKRVMSMKESIRTVNIKRLRESKDKFIDRNHNLTDEEKEEIKTFFNRHPSVQSMINWSDAVDLEYEDFKRVMTSFKHRKVMENRANRLAGRFVEKKNRLKEANFYNFVDLIDGMGWGYSNFQNVTDKSGKPYERFTLTKGGSNEKQSPADIEEVKNAIRKMFGNDVSFGTCHSKYAPENVYTTVIINSEKL